MNKLYQLKGEHDRSLECKCVSTHTILARAWDSMQLCERIRANTRFGIGQLGKLPRSSS